MATESKTYRTKYPKWNSDKLTLAELTNRQRRRANLVLKLLVSKSAAKKGE